MHTLIHTHTFYSLYKSLHCLFPLTSSLISFPTTNRHLKKIRYIIRYVAVVSWSAHLVFNWIIIMQVNQQLLSSFCTEVTSTRQVRVCHLCLPIDPESHLYFHFYPTMTNIVDPLKDTHCWIPYKTLTVFWILLEVCLDWGVLVQALTTAHSTASQRQTWTTACWDFQTLFLRTKSQNKVSFNCLL